MGTEGLKIVEFNSDLKKIPGWHDPDQPDPGLRLEGEAKNILVVDDTPTWLHVVRRVLSEGGYEVQVCNNPVEFSQSPEQFDLVLTDLQMPCLNGIELAAKLLRINPAVPVVLTSAEDCQMTTEQLHTLGIRSFLAKPWRSKQLLSQIRQALESCCGKG